MLAVAPVLWRGRGGWLFRWFGIRRHFGLGRLGDAGELSEGHRKTVCGVPAEAQIV
ncbi:MAG TPA: hypothetical protein VED84_06575 [Acidimicrobiales bacterium]|nr:hypothetical protein [Acidimicrobiales bacterium]